MGKVIKGKVMSHRELKAEKYKQFKGNKTEGQGFADIRKKRAASKYRKMLAKEKRKLAGWTEKLEKIYADAEKDSDDEQHLEVKVKRQKNQKVGQKLEEGLSCGESNAGSVKDSQKSKTSVKKQKMSAYHQQEKEAQRRKSEKLKQQQELDERRCERDAAVQRHKKLKSHQHKLLSKRNYKGQPNLASRMELLLEKITQQQHT